MNFCMKNTFLMLFSLISKKTSRAHDNEVRNLTDLCFLVTFRTVLAPKRSAKGLAMSYAARHVSRFRPIKESKPLLKSSCGSAATA